MSGLLDWAADALVPALPAGFVLVPVGFFLKWATRPCVLSFGAGLHVGKILGRKQAGKHARATTAAR